MKIFTLFLFCLPVSLWAQTEAEMVWQKTNEKLNTSQPFKVKTQYLYKGLNQKENKSGTLIQYFHLVDTTQHGYLKYDYLIEGDTIEWVKMKNIKFRHIPKQNNFFHDLLYEDWETIENPLITGLIKPEKVNEFYVYEEDNCYLLFFNLRGNNAAANYPDANDVKYEYRIRKSDYSILRLTKIIQTEKGELYNHLSFETESISEPKFNRQLNKYINSSGYMLGRELMMRSIDSISFFKENNLADSIPPFSIETLDGKIISNTDSSKLILMDFWFVACKPCQMAMPYLQKIHEKFKDKGLVVLGLNPYDKDTLHIQRTLKKYRITYPVSLEAAMLTSELKVDTYPTLFLINNKGEIIKTEVGFNEMGMKELEKLIIEELKK